MFLDMISLCLRVSSFVRMLVDLYCAVFEIGLTAVVPAH
jgi:hypothetical protein